MHCERNATANANSNVNTNANANAMRMQVQMQRDAAHLANANAMRMSPRRSTQHQPYDPTPSSTNVNYQCYAKGVFFYAGVGEE